MTDRRCYLGLPQHTLEHTRLLAAPGHETGDRANYFCRYLKLRSSKVELQAIQGDFSARRLSPIVLPIIEK